MNTAVGARQSAPKKSSTDVRQAIGTERPIRADS
jgi:hypothetical protein